MITQPKSKSFIFGALACLICGWYSYHLGRDLSWDLANYHIYNAFTYIHQRQSIDYWPVTFIHQFFSPTLDIFTYALFKRLSDAQLTFFMGALHGLNIYFIFRISQLYLQDTPEKTLHYCLYVIFSIVGMLSALTAQSIGDLRHDLTANLFTMWGILSLAAWLSPASTASPRHTNLVLSGFMFGIAVGLKLTTITFLIGAVLAILPIAIPMRTRFSAILTIGAFAGIGILVSNGYWMLAMWQQHHNPLFPFLNNLFQSPDYPKTAFSYHSLSPKTLWENITFPISLSLFGNGEADTPFRDLRYGIIYLLFITYVVKISYQFILGKRHKTANKGTVWLFLFTIFSFAIWQYEFAITRYLTPITLLSPLIIFLLIKELFSAKEIIYALTFLSLYLIIYTIHPEQRMLRSSDYSTYFDIKAPSQLIQQKDALVLMSFPETAINNQPKPLTYLIPLLPPDWKYIGIPFAGNTKTRLTNKQIRLIQSRLKRQKKSIFLIGTDRAIPTLKRMAKTLGLSVSKHCDKISDARQRVSGNETQICQAKKS